MAVPSESVPPDKNRTRLKAVLFSGGRGASSIATALVGHPQIDLTILVNTYDDGLSTGRLRRFIPGMLGPSDVRKNMSTLSRGDERCSAAVKLLLDYRFPDGTPRSSALRTLEMLAGGTEEASEPAVAKAYGHLMVCQTAVIARYVRAFLRYEHEQQTAGRPFDFGDCSIGNLLFAGCYLEAGEDFNRAVRDFAAFSESRGTVLNVTDGTSYVLTAVDTDGRYLPDEASIVSPRQGSSVEEIFLLDGYLPEAGASALAAMPKAGKLAWLRARHRTPRANPEALAALRAADLIIYGPGTQSSSLLPSYLTEGVMEAITANAAAEKVFVSNILYDHDIEGRTVHDILDAFLYSMSRKGSVSCDPDELITNIFVQRPDAANLNRATSSGYVKYDIAALAPRKVWESDWEAGLGQHSGGQIVDEMLSVVQGLLAVKIAPFRHTLSIVVPALDEARTVEKVLEDLERLDVGRLGLNKEIVLVDGGSTDGTLELARRHPSVRVYSLGDLRGRGEAIKLGISKVRGNVVVLFPSDDEYDAQDILAVAEPVMKNQFSAVYGSRMIKCVDLSERIRAIYGENRLGYLVSKYGGMLFSILSLVLFKRFISDPFTTFKAFDGSLLKEMQLNASGVDLEAEIVAKLSKRRVFILEVPVQYRPRTRAQGKKTRLSDGLRTLFSLVAWSVRRDSGAPEDSLAIEAARRGEKALGPRSRQVAPTQSGPGSATPPAAS